MNKKTKKYSDNFSGVIELIGDKFDNIGGRLDNLESMFRDLQGSVDAYAKRADTYFQEMVMLSHKVNRHEKWLRQIAEKIGIKLQS